MKQPGRAGGLLTARHVTKAFGAVRVIGDLTLVAREGEFLSIVGPSGCGKTTLLMTLAGLLEADGGEISFDGKRIKEPPPGLAVVFQGVFWTIGSDPAKYRALMPYAVAEKLVFGVPCLALWVSGYPVNQPVALFAGVDLLLGLGFFLAWRM